METKNQSTDPGKVKSSRPNQPVATFLQEAENLYVWCIDDTPELKKAGIDEALITELPQNIKVCREAQVVWETKLKTRGNAQVQWKVQLPEALTIRTELLQSMRFAFRNHSDLSNKIKNIAKGNSYASLIQDLYDLSVLGRKHSESLIIIGFDLELLDRAAAKSEELAGLWALSKNEKGRINEAAIARNKAFWYLHRQVAEIRSAGQYVFRHQKDRYVGYVSQYWKHKNGRRSIPDQ